MKRANQYEYFNRYRTEEKIQQNHEEIEQAIDQVITVSSARVRAAFDGGKTQASQDAPNG